MYPAPYLFYIIKLPSLFSEMYMHNGTIFKKNKTKVVWIKIFM